MKRSVCLVMTIILCLMVFMPVSVYAETYHLGGTDISIQVDDSSWYVFTRDNIKDNPELDELEISYDTIHDILYNNKAYMDALLLQDGGEYVELFVRKKPLDTVIGNLSNYKDSEVQKFAKELAAKYDDITYSVYKNTYKFAKLEYIDQGYYLCEFVTVVNKDNYTLTFQSTSPYTDEEYTQIMNIVDSVRFDVDTSIKEPITFNVVEATIHGAIIGGIVGLVVAIIKKKKKKSSKTDNVAVAGNAESE